MFAILCERIARRECIIADFLLFDAQHFEANACSHEMKGENENLRRSFSFYLIQEYATRSSSTTPCTVRYDVWSILLFRLVSSIGGTADPNRMRRASSHIKYDFCMSARFGSIVSETFV